MSNFSGGSRDDDLINLEEPSATSENSIEVSNPQVKTNLNQNQLVFFRSYGEEIKSDLSLCSDENTIWINFPKIYLDYNVSISLIGPDSNDEHDMLKLVPLPSHDYPIHNKKIVFKITPERLNLKLDFFGIQILEAEEDNASNAYRRNTARLLITVSDRYEEPFISFKSQIIRNKNLKVSESISISSIKPGKSEENNIQHIIKFKHSVPYFQEEMQVKIKGNVYIHTTRDVFPIKKISIEYPESKLKKSDISISTIFSKQEETNRNHKQQKKTKGICFLINQIEFVNGCKSRESGSKIDNKNIKKVFTRTLNYKVHQLISLTKNELTVRIQEKIKDYHEHIVVFVLSHGDINGFCTREENGYFKFDEFVKIFRQKFTNKPIIFFFSCCLDEKYVKSEAFFTIEDLSKSPNIFMGFATLPGFLNISIDFSETPYIETLLGVIKNNPELGIVEIHEKTKNEMGVYFKYMVVPERFKDKEPIPCGDNLLDDFNFHFKRKNFRSNWQCFII